MNIFLSHLEQNQQDWFKNLISQKAEFLHHTVEKEGKLVVFKYTYNVYLNNNIYQVTVSRNRLCFIRHLYKNIQGDNVITFETVADDQVIEDEVIHPSIENILNAIK